MKTKINAKSLTADETAQTFESDLARADATRADALTGLSQLRSARANHVKREQDRLAETLGADHPEVLRLKVEAADDRRFIGELDSEIDRAQIETPVVDKQTWVLHGHVRDENLAGQPDLTVALLDRAGRWIEGLGHACTDRRGYFRLQYQSATGTGAARKAPATASIPNQELFIQVSNRRQEAVHRDRRPVMVRPGQVQYREIILSDENASCPPPTSPSSESSPPSSKGPSKPPGASVKARKTSRRRG